MSDPVGADPILLPFRQWQFDLIWGAFTVASGIAAAAVLLTASTTGGQAVGGSIFGAACVGCVVGRPNATSLQKSTSSHLRFMLVGSTRSAYWALVQAGTDTRLDVQGFPKEDV